MQLKPTFTNNLKNSKLVECGLFTLTQSIQKYETHKCNALKDKQLDEWGMSAPTHLVQ